MSHFYGTLQAGNRAQVTRCGHKATGLTTHAAGWGGAVRVTVWRDTDTDTDQYSVNLIPWKYSGGNIKCIARGELKAEN